MWNFQIWSDLCCAKKTKTTENCWMKKIWINKGKLKNGIFCVKNRIKKYLERRQVVWRRFLSIEEISIQSRYLDNWWRRGQYCRKRSKLAWTNEWNEWMSKERTFNFTRLHSCSCFESLFSFLQDFFINRKMSSI